MFRFFAGESKEYAAKEAMKAETRGHFYRPF